MGSNLFAVLAAVAESDIALLFILVALACLLGAAYLAFYRRDAFGCVLLCFVAVLALLFGT